MPIALSFPTKTDTKPKKLKVPWRKIRGFLSNATTAPPSVPSLAKELGKLQIDRIELGESFLGEAVNISLTGNASLIGGEGATNVTAIRLDETAGKFIIDD